MHCVPYQPKKWLGAGSPELTSDAQHNDVLATGNGQIPLDNFPSDISPTLLG